MSFRKSFFIMTAVILFGTNTAMALEECPTSMLATYYTADECQKKVASGGQCCEVCQRTIEADTTYNCPMGWFYSAHTGLCEHLKLAGKETYDESQHGYVNEVWGTCEPTIITNQASTTVYYEIVTGGTGGAMHQKCLANIVN